jgi:plastocyanin
MVWKIVIISIAIVFAAIIIGGAIIVTQVLTSIPNFANDDNNNDRNPSPINPEQNSSSAVEGTVRIVDNAGNNSYSPNPFEAKVGETVTWVNDDSAIHTATSTDGIFDSDILQRGQTFSYTFDKEGEYPYFCTLHPNMVGIVIIVR